MSKPLIVCVDDSQSILNLLNKQLQRRFGDRYDYEFAESAEEALEVIEEAEEDGEEVIMVISDQIMPGMYGDQLLVRLQNEYPKVVKILLTGQAGLDSAINAINNADLFRYLTKPWQEEDFLLTVEKGLRQYYLVNTLEDQVEQLKRLDKTKDEFLANTSHELLTPLNGVVGLSESLIDGAGGKLPKQAAKDLNLISSCGRRLTSLVNQILDFSKLKHQNLTLDLKPVDLRALVEVVITLSQPLLKNRPVLLTNRIGGDLRPVLADENRLQQILHNLIGNSIKFTKSGQINVGASVVGDQVNVDIIDTGIGIAAEMHEKIFESFQQGDGSTARLYGGTGLGLAVTRQLVELHGGTIGVTSESGEGSTFTFSLALAEEGAAAETSRPDLPAVRESDEEIVESGHSETSIQRELLDETAFNILVVDDDLVNRRVLLNHLSGMNYRLVEAEDGPTALTILDNQPFDLILLDVMMPHMSGYEVCRNLRENFPVHELPVIYLSAKGQDQDIATGFSSGANDYLTKPIAKPELLHRVRTHLQLLDVNRNLEHKVKIRTQALAQKNKHITESIQYAKHIQDYIFPVKANIHSELDAFIIFRSKEIVSGDFYWFYDLDGSLFIGAIDCTGHGVPGAFMSILGYSLLRRIICEEKIQDPAAILERLDKDVRTMLRQEDSARYALNGMDMGLCRIAPDRKSLVFAGAKRPLFLVRPEKEPALHDIPGDRRTVGGRRNRKLRSFTNHEIPLTPDCMIYLTTDGWVDQPSADGRKYGSPRLREFLRRHAHLDVEMQKAILEEELDTHQGDCPQRDDITLIGVKF